MANKNEKSIKEAIWYVVDEPKFIEDKKLAHFDFWVKIKAQVIDW